MRVFHSFKHTITTFLDQIENQEAVALAGIRELEQGAARVRVHRRRCERRIEQLEQRIAALELETKTWRERILRSRDDRERALECTRRHRAAEAARLERAGELERQWSLREKIVRDEDAVEAKLAELRTRCARLSSREVRASAHGLIAAGDIDCVFDRWEARLDGMEPAEDSAAEDNFARTFSREEDDFATQAELERILVEGSRDEVKS